MTHRTRTVAAGLGLLTLALSGCGSGTETSHDSALSTESSATSGRSDDATQVSSTDEFWSTLRPYSASEVDPATDLADLTKQATTIVRGKIDSISPGPAYPDTSDDGQVDKGETSFVTVQVEEYVKGSPGKTVTVWLAGPGSDLNIPKDSYLWYLKPSERSGIMYPASLSGVIGPGGNGLTTVLAPGDASFIVPPRVDSISELETQTESLTQD